MGTAGFALRRVTGWRLLCGRKKEFFLPSRKKRKNKNDASQLKYCHKKVLVIQFYGMEPRFCLSATLMKGKRMTKSVTFKTTHRTALARTVPVRHTFADLSSRGASLPANRNKRPGVRTPANINARPRSYPKYVSDYSSRIPTSGKRVPPKRRSVPSWAYRYGAALARSTPLSRASALLRASDLIAAIADELAHLAPAQQSGEKPGELPVKTVYYPDWFYDRVEFFPFNGERWMYPGVSLDEGAAYYERWFAQGSPSKTTVISDHDSVEQAHWPVYYGYEYPYGDIWHERYVIPPGRSVEETVRTEITTWVNPQPFPDTDPFPSVPFPIVREVERRIQREAEKAPGFSPQLEVSFTPGDATPLVRPGQSTKGRSNDHKTRKGAAAMAFITGLLNWSSEMLEAWEIIRDEIGIRPNVSNQDAFEYLYNGGWENITSEQWARIATGLATNVIVDKIIGPILGGMGRTITDAGLTHRQLGV